MITDIGTRYQAGLTTYKNAAMKLENPNFNSAGKGRLRNCIKIEIS